MCDDVMNNMIAKVNEQYGHLVFTIAFNILKDYQESEDVVQTVLLNMLSKHEKMLNCENLRSYLCISARNAAIDSYRKKKRDAQADAYVFWKLTENSVEMDAFNDKYGFGMEMQELIRQLDNIDKDIICMKYGLRSTYKEIAVILGMSEEAVRKRAQRALNKLKDILLDGEVNEND